MNAIASPTEQALQAPLQAPLDALGRPLQSLRISVTDRCNFRCGYCMPRAAFAADHAFLPRPELLTFEETTRLAALLVELGVGKIRLTGGEPLLRKHLHVLVGRLAALRCADGSPLELALSTNGSLLARQAPALKEAGLQRVAVSLDALEPAAFERACDTSVPVSDVLAGVETALAVGLQVKVNAVVRRGVNEDQVIPLVRHFRGTPVELRFIEFMDVGQTNAWNRDQVTTSDTLRERIAHLHPLQALPARGMGETAQRHAYVDGQGTVGFISSVSHAFCHDCTRLRLSADGRLYTCLFATQGQDVRQLLRGGSNDAALLSALRTQWQRRDDRYSELRQHRTTPRTVREQRIEMSYIGG